MMVSCPGCNNQYLVDERKVPAQGALLNCRECGTQLKVPPPPTATTGPTTTSSPPASMAAVTPETSHVGEISGKHDKPVTCPQCGHIFLVSSARTHAPLLPAARRPDRRQGRILLVEDQSYFAELTREALGEDFETTVTTNLPAARRLVGAGGYDLVILDLSLEEGEDGAQVLQATRRLGIPVLIFTARDETELYSGVWDQLKAAGATDILIKGMNVGEELRQKVKALLTRPLAKP